MSASLALFGVTYQTLIPVLADQVYGHTQRWTVGFGVTFVSTATNAYLQQRLPAHLRGGMIALYLTSFNAVVPFGQMVAGALAERGGALLAYQVSSLALLACLAYLYVPRWTAARHFETDATRL